MNVGDDVLMVLSTVKIEGNALRIPGQLERKLYERTNKVLVAAGGKWNSKTKAHLFESDPADVIDRVILSGTIAVPKSEFGYFPTPPNLVTLLLERARLDLNHRVLEPSAGQGAIALEIAKVCEVDCVEIMPANFRVLVQRAAESGLFPSTAGMREGDFLSVPPQRIYDRVVMNPPFAKQADIRHVMHALQFVKRGGRLVSVMAAGVTFRLDQLALYFRRDLLNVHRSTIEPLPDGSFKESGTMVRTVLVTIDIL